MNCPQALGLADVSAAEGCIVYYVVTRRGVLYLIDVYANSETEDLTDAERHEIRKLVAALEAEEVVRLAGGSLLASIALKRRQWRLPADRETSPSFLWFAAIQGIERKERLADLAPQGCFIAAEAVECVIGQIGETQEAACQLISMMNVRRILASS